MNFFEISYFRFLAEAVRFELTVPFGTPVFKTGALNHYATPPLWIFDSAFGYYQKYVFYASLLL